MEVAPYNDWMTTHPQFCPSCLTIHAFSYRKHPQSCIKLNTNGPRRLKDLSLSDIWKSDAQVLVVGHKNLMYQPPLLKNTFINISSSDMWDYAVPTSANAIFTNCVRHETSLIARINHVPCDTASRPLMLQTHSSRILWTWWISRIPCCPTPSRLCPCS